MILTEYDAVCCVDDLAEMESEELRPIDYLVSKMGLVSKPMGYYGYDETENLIKIRMLLESTSIKPFFSNLFGITPLHIVDTLHGFFKNCHVKNIQLVRHFSYQPHINIQIVPGNISPWTEDLPSEAFISREDDKGILSGSIPRSTGEKDVAINGVEISLGYNVSAQTTSPVNRITKSLIAEIQRSGEVSVKQIIALKAYIENPTDPQIINNLRGRIFFLGQGSTQAPSDHGFEMQWGKTISIPVKDAKLRDLTYVADVNLQFPTDAKEVESEQYREWPYRLYYDGRLNLADKTPPKMGVEALYGPERV